MKRFERPGGRHRAPPIERWAWPTAIGAAGLAWYAADSLRHRREGKHGYDLVHDIDVADPGFLRAAESLTGAPISEGNDAELLINGDSYLSRLPGDDRGRRADPERRDLRLLDG